MTHGRAQFGLYAALLFIQNILQVLSTYLAKPLGAELIQAAASGEKLSARFTQAAISFVIIPPVIAFTFFHQFEAVAASLLRNYFPQYAELSELIGLFAFACSLFPAMSLFGLVVLEPSMKATKLFAASQLLPALFLILFYAIFHAHQSVFVILITSLALLVIFLLF